MSVQVLRREMLRNFCIQEMSAMFKSKRFSEPVLSLIHRRRFSSNTHAHNFSFSGSGFLIAYHLGVAKELQTLGVVNESSKVAGASGGAIAATALAAGIPMENMLTLCKEMANTCKEQGTMWNLENILKAYLLQHMPINAFETVRGRLSIASTKMSFPKPVVIHVDAFKCNEDLIETILTSSFIPMYASNNLTRQFRGDSHVDGGILELVPMLEGYVRVCVFPAKTLMREDYEISPSILSTFPFSLPRLLKHAMTPPEGDFIDELYEKGQESAREWYNQKILRTE